MFDLIGKKALVTGSTQGIGFAVAKKLAEQGALVFVNGRSEDKTLQAAKRIRGAKVAVCDLSLDGCEKQLYEITGEVDILVLNASVQIRKKWNEITDEEYEAQMNVNFKAPMKLIQIYAPKMLENRWGRIVTVGSVQQAKPHKDMLVYASSKAAMCSMALNLAKQFAPFGVTVNNVAPGVIDTPRNEKALGDEQYAKKVLEGIPSSYVGMPEDCAAQILLLCSDEGRYMTGENIYIDGGMKL